jgi:hypothetical protein
VTGRDANDESRVTRERRGDDQATTETTGRVHRFAEALKKQFRDLARMLTKPADAPEPKARRRRTGDAAEFRKASEKILARAERLPAAAYAAVTFLSDTLDWLNPWHSEPDCTDEIEADFQQTQQDHFSLHM